jgi:hypothetical protein
MYFQDLKLTSRYTSYFKIINLIYKILFALIIVFMDSWIKEQIGLLTTITLLRVIYVTLFRPYKRLERNILTVVADIVLGICLIMKVFEYEKFQ